ncbi:MAG: S1C family serine protease, partial [Lachnospirales bacterium]
LINTRGEVIGINTAKLSDSSVEGTGYAIPTSTAKAVIDELISNGSIQKAYLGISGATITDDFRYMYGIDVKGVYISKVEQGSAAEKAGIQRSDIITAVDGTNITTIDELSKIISSHKPNDVIKMSIVRNGTNPMEVQVTLADANSKF